MERYVILSKVSPDALTEPEEFKGFAQTVKQKIKDECPDVNWKESYAVNGAYDVVDIVESDDPSQVTRAAMIIRSYGHSETQTMSATPWDEFLENL